MSGSILDRTQTDESVEQTEATKKNRLIIALYRAHSQFRKAGAPLETISPEECIIMAHTHTAHSHRQTPPVPPIYTKLDGCEKGFFQHTGARTHILAYRLYSLCPSVSR